MSNLTPVTAYADKKGKLHLSESGVYKANNEYERESYNNLLRTYYVNTCFQYYMSTKFLNALSITTLRSMCIDLKVLS